MRKNCSVLEISRNRDYSWKEECNLTALGAGMIVWLRMTLRAETSGTI